MAHFLKYTTDDKGLHGRQGNASHKITDADGLTCHAGNPGSTRKCFGAALMDVIDVKLKRTFKRSWR